MTFKKGQARPAGAGRKKGSGNKLTFDVKAALMLHGPALARELVDLALHCKNPAVRVIALREALDRICGKASQPVEGQITHGISLDLQRLLQQHDGESRSVPVRNGGTLIEHADDDDNDRSDNGSGSALN